MDRKQERKGGKQENEQDETKDKVERKSEAAVTQLSVLKRFYISARPRTCVSLSRSKICLHYSYSSTALSPERRWKMRGLNEA